MRARRAVVVGDPLQIEPVVTLPLSLVEKVCQSFGVDAEEWAAPKASAQTLADSGSLYQGWIERSDGAVRIGAPLLVHRRCEQPMFGISNTISYARLMVRATRDRSSRIRDVLGPSRWLHLEGFSDGKWCPQEGEVALDLVAQLVRAGIADPDVFLIAPFRAVAYGLRDRFRSEADVLARITSAPQKWLYDRIGTVHTVQGKEAEAVIFVLGATNAQQTGARSWAGSPPNLVNVAVSRAKQALYVIGNRNIWHAHGSFQTLAERMDFQDLSR